MISEWKSRKSKSGGGFYTYRITESQLPIYVRKCYLEANFADSEHSKLHADAFSGANSADVEIIEIDVIRLNDLVSWNLAQ